MNPIALAHTPTPVRRLDTSLQKRLDLWVKDDGVIHPRFGGNKIRKLEYLLASALHKGARRIVTSGAAGSHHVLATALFGREQGLPVVAVVCPQRRTPHATSILSAILHSGAELVVVGSKPAVAPATLRVWRRGDYLIPPGGSNVTGTLGYVSAARELVSQIRAGDAPDPDVIVVPLGSGGTAAGLLAGVVREGLRARVLAVQVATRGPVGEAMVVGLAYPALRRDGGRASPLSLLRHLEVDTRHLGAGYGEPSAAGSEAMQVAAKHGLVLDPTYTGKTFACVLERARSVGPRETWIYWHTLNAAPLAPLQSPDNIADDALFRRLLPP
ncbi:MAG: pyridoxal-phosphate dependent enzyme [Polyangiaceae bacterium]